MRKNEIPEHHLFGQRMDDHHLEGGSGMGRFGFLEQSHIALSVELPKVEAAGAELGGKWSHR
jgi:hypothetical protein